MYYICTYIIIEKEKCNCESSEVVHYVTFKPLFDYIHICCMCKYGLNDNNLIEISNFHYIRTYSVANYFIL